MHLLRECKTLHTIDLSGCSDALTNLSFMVDLEEWARQDPLRTLRLPIKKKKDPKAETNAESSNAKRKIRSGTATSAAKKRK